MIKDDSVKDFSFYISETQKSIKQITELLKDVDDSEINGLLADDELSYSEYSIINKIKEDYAFYNQQIGRLRYELMSVTGNIRYE